MTKRRLLLLDLDGTLVDSFCLLFECFRQSVAPLVRRLPTDHEIVATFGPAEEECIAMLLRTWQAQGLLNRPLEPQDIFESGKRFHQLYEAGQDTGQVTLYPHMREILDEFHRAGWALGIFTGKGRGSAISTLQHQQILSLFDAVVTSNDVANPKPAPDGVMLAIQQAGSLPNLTTFVGDNPADILSGRAAGVTAAAALWGAFNRTETLAAQPHRIFESPSDLRLLL